MMQGEFPTSATQSNFITWAISWLPSFHDYFPITLQEVDIHYSESRALQDLLFLEYKVNSNSNIKFYFLQQ